MKSIVLKLRIETVSVGPRPMLLLHTDLTGLGFYSRIYHRRTHTERCRITQSDSAVMGLTRVCSIWVCRATFTHRLITTLSVSEQHHLIVRWLVSWASRAVRRRKWQCATIVWRRWWHLCSYVTASNIIPSPSTVESSSKDPRTPSNKAARCCSKTGDNGKDKDSDAGNGCWWEIIGHLLPSTTYIPSTYYHYSLPHNQWWRASTRINNNLTNWLSRDSNSNKKLSFRTDSVQCRCRSPQIKSII